MPEENIQQPTADAVEPTTPVEPTKPDEVKSPDGLLSTLNKYKELGSVEQIERAKLAAQQFESLAGAISQEGFDVSTLPDTIKRIKQQEELEGQLKERFDAQLQIERNEKQRIASEKDGRISELEQSIIERDQKDLVRPYFAANALPEAVGEWDAYWNDIKPFVKFKTDEQTGKRVVDHVLDPNGEPKWINKSGEPARPADVVDLINDMIDGKYGFRLKSAMKPATAAMGGGAVSPGRTTANGMVRVGRHADWSKLTPEQMKAIRENKYVVE